jgi:hypothetical protein
MNTFKGANIVERLGNATWSLAEGWRTSKVYEGSHTAIDNFLPVVRQQLLAESISIERNGDTSILTAYFGRNNDLPESGIATWELLANDLTKDNYEHPNALDFPDSVMTAVKQAVARFEDQTIEEPYTIDQGRGHIVQACLTNPGGAYSPINPVSLFYLRIRGQDSYAIDAYVLRKVHYVSNYWEQKLPYTGVRFLWTGTDINNAEIANYGVGIPPGIAFDINQIPAPKEREGYYWSWLKKAPQSLVVSQNKIQLISEWWLEQWALFDYDRYVP